MTTADMMRAFGKIEAKLELIHDDVRTNKSDIEGLKAFRSRVRGAAWMTGVAAATFSGAVGAYAKLRGIL